MNTTSTKTKELPPFPFPLFLDSSTLYDDVLEKRLPLEMFLKHDGYKVEFEGKMFLLSISDPKDTLILKTNDYKGISRAGHFYGTLVLPIIEFQEEETGNFHCGYGVPRVPHKVELHRPLTKDEILNDRKRWEGYSVGEMVLGFNTFYEVFSRARVIAAEYFPGFKLKAD